MKFGALVTAVLFEAGKFLIGMYLGSSAAVSSLGAAGALLALLFWVYYSSQIFLFGAALTKARAEAAGRSQIAQTAASAPTPHAYSSSHKHKEATSVLTLALTLLVRGIVLMIVGRRRKSQIHSRRR